MLHGQPKARGRTIVEYVHCKLLETDLLCKPVDETRQVVERVLKAAACRHVGLPESGQIGREHVEPIRELRDQVPEHVTGARKSMQEQELWGSLEAGFPIEDLQAANLSAAIVDSRHGYLSPQNTSAVTACRLLPGPRF